MSDTRYRLDDLVRVTRGTETPVVFTWVASAPEGREALDTAGFAVFDDPTRRLRALTALLGLAR